MSQNFSMRPIAHIHSDFSTKFGVPRQSGLVDALESTIVFEPEFRDPDALRGLEGFSHLWLVWVFDQSIRSTWSPTVRPPRLGGNARMGVFATRSPFRPNPIALSCVKLAEILHTPDQGSVLRVLGAESDGWYAYFGHQAIHPLCGLPSRGPGRLCRSTCRRSTDCGRSRDLCWHWCRPSGRRPFGAYWPKIPPPLS